MKIKIEDIAKVCHEVNRAYCKSIGDDSIQSWESAPEWQKRSAISGVRFKIENPEKTPSDQHDAWVADKVKDGWKYGAIKDSSKKEHPCLVEYDQLPANQKSKDFIFSTIVLELIDINCD